MIDRDKNVPEEEEHGSGTCSGNNDGDGVRKECYAEIPAV